MIDNFKNFPFLKDIYILKDMLCCRLNTDTICKIAYAAKTIKKGSIGKRYLTSARKTM